MDRKVALQIVNTTPWQHTMEEMAKQGFKYVSFAFSDENTLVGNDWKAYVESVGEVIYKNGLKCVMTHSPYTDLLVSAEVRDDKMETAIVNCMEATKMLGADLCAVHPRSVIVKGLPREEAVDRRRSLEENLKSFLPVVDACEKHGVTLGIENLMKYPHAHPSFYSYIVEDQCELIDKLGSKKVGAVWDFGHANLVDEDHAQRILTLGNRIKGTHVHNNDGIEDNHYAPFMPPKNAYYARRTVDWNSVLSALKKTGYDGYLTLETILNFDYPIAPYIKYLYESVCTLYEILQASEN